MSEWQDISTAPHSGKFLVAMYAPTSWAYYVDTVVVYQEMPKVREQRLRYCTHWMPMLPEPPSKAKQVEKDQ